MKIACAAVTRKLGIVAIFLLFARPSGSREQQIQPANNESVCKIGGQWEAGCYEKLVQAIPTIKGKAEYLARVIDALQSQIQSVNRVADTLEAKSKGADLEKAFGIEPVGTYQIAATRYEGGDGLSFAQVFRVNTRTGNVCQVIGPNSRNGEGMGTSISICPR
jgi:hypothetical protein